MERIKTIFENDPYLKHLGIEIEEVGKGYSRVSVRINEHMINFLGLPHGGLIFSVADAAFAAACNSHGIKAVAAQVDIHFLSSPAIGERIVAEAREEKLTKRLGYYTIVVRNERLEPIARCQAVAYRTSSDL